MHARHYESARPSEVRQRLESLFDHPLATLRSRDLGPIVAYAEQVARERFAGGYDLSEAQTAFNTLEEATWTRVFAGLQPAQFAEALGLVSTILGAARTRSRAAMSRSPPTHTLLHSIFKPCSRARRVARGCERWLYAFLVSGNRQHGDT
jgi:hypothetical protein